MTADKPPSRGGDAGHPGAWSAHLAEELGRDSGPTLTLAPQTVGALLRIARDVAHASERLNAPLSTYLAGRYVAARVTAGCDEAMALAEVEGVVRRLLATTPEG